MIKHISLDFWNTIATGNSQFSDFRADIISKNCGVSQLFAKKAYTHVKKKADSDAETFGVSNTTEDNYKNLAAVLRCNSVIGNSPDDFLHQFLMGRFIEKFKKLIPNIDDEVFKAILALRDKGFTFNISSNTNFIPGEHIRLAINENAFLKSNKIDVNDLFDFCVFSDELKFTTDQQSTQCYSKPALQFFDEVFFKSSILHSGLKRQEILHIGDNEVCDFVGSQDAGFSQKLISGPDALPDALYSLIA